MNGTIQRPAASRASMTLLAIRSSFGNRRAIKLTDERPLLFPARRLAIARISSLERERRQPGFAADGPEFVGRQQLVRGIQGPQVHFDFVRATAKDRRAAA